MTEKISHEPTPTPQHPEVIGPKIVDTVKDLRTYEDVIQVATDQAVRTIGAFSPERQASLFAKMDDQDARDGLRERRSDLVRQRMAVLAEQDAMPAPKDPIAVTPKDPSVPPHRDTVAGHR